MGRFIQSSVQEYGEELQSSEQPEERSLAAEIIGAIGNPAFYHGLEVLISDPHLRVRQAALEAAGQLGSLQLLDCVLSAFPTLRFRATPWLHCVTMAQWQLIHCKDTIRSSECPLSETPDCRTLGSYANQRDAGASRW